MRSTGGRGTLLGGCMVTALLSATSALADTGPTAELASLVEPSSAGASAGSATFGASVAATSDGEAASAATSEPDEAASAGPKATSPDEPPDALTVQPPVRSVAITVSPLHLFSPIVELTGEFALSRRFGAALLVGYGSVDGQDPEGDAGETVSLTAFELGASARFYLIGNFDKGMQIGVEALYLHVALDAGEEYSGSGAGVALGPFVGYKFTSKEGFTFDGQLGFQVLAAEAESGGTTANGGGVIPLLNLNIGWAF